MSAIARLPEDIYLQVFSHFTPAELALCSQVHPEWRRLASDNWVWREQGRKLFGQYLNVPNVKEFLREYHSQQLRSNDEIVARIQDFANRVSLGHNGRFRCIIGAGRGHRVISVEIKGDREKLHPVLGAPRAREDDVREFDVKDTAYALHIVGNGDLINPEPSELHHWDKARGDHEQRYACTEGPFRAVLRIPTPLESETDFDTALYFKGLEHPTQMHQKIANILRRKVISLKAQNDRKPDKRMLVVGVLILLLSFYLRKYESL